MNKIHSFSVRNEKNFVTDEYKIASFNLKDGII